MLDSDIAQLYGVETKRINEAVKNNPDKFSLDLMFELSGDEWGIFKVENFDLKRRARLEVEIFDFKLGRPQKASESIYRNKGVYMLATA